MEFHNDKTAKPDDSLHAEKPSEHRVEVDLQSLLSVTEKICQHGNCRYPLLALRILIHCIAHIDSAGHIPISARHLAKSMDVHYDTVSKCLKYLRQAGILRIER